MLLKTSSSPQFALKVLGTTLVLLALVASTAVERPIVTDLPETGHSIPV